MSAVSTAMLDMIRRQKQKYQNNNTKIKKPAEGKTRLRILPVEIKGSPVAEPGQFALEFGVHWIKMEPKGKPVVVVGDTLLLYGKLSPITQMVDKMITNPASTDEEIAFFKDLKARKMILVNALNRTPSSSDASEIPAPYELTPPTWAKVLGLIEEYASTDGQFALDYKTGIDIIIERTGKGFDTEYTVMPAFGTSKPVTQESIDKAIDLFAFIEKEHFRVGDDTKALTALQELSGGMAIPALPAGPRTASPLLTSARPVDAGARIAAEKAKIEAEKAEIAELVEASAGIVEASPVDDEEAALQAQLAALKAKKAAAAAKPAAKPAAAPATAPKIEDTAFDQDIDANTLLAELENL